MKTYPLILFLAALTLCACDDFGTATVTYTKGTAIYGDLEALRQTPLLGGAREITDAGKIYLGGDVLLIGEEGEGIHVVDNTDPENPVPRSFLTIPGNREFFVDGSTLYAESLYDMLKIDISNLSAPSLVAREENAFSTEFTNSQGEALIGFELGVVTETLDKDSDIYDQVWNSSGPTYFDYEQNLIPPSAVPASFAGNSNRAIGSVNRVVSHEDHVYVVGKTKLSVFDATSGLDLVFQQDIGWNMETVYPMGARIFIGSQNSVEIYNVSNPSSPTYESSFWHATSCDPVFPVDEETAYVTLRTGDFAECPGDVNALIVLDISTMTTAQQVQEIEMESPYGLTMIGDFLYVGEGENGLKIFDASDRRSLRMEEWQRNMQAYDVLAHPTRPDLLMIAGPEGLSQFRTGLDLEFQLLSHVAF
ncbi:MAG: hypothetical protein AAGA85_09060 [Bacteroidota bacterium]